MLVLMAVLAVLMAVVLMVVVMVIVHVKVVQNPDKQKNSQVSPTTYSSHKSEL